MSSDVKNILIIGGGIVGCTTAYYLASHPRFSPATTTITLIEASKAGVAQGASGKAGGLVAKWAYPEELVAVSFPEHVRLAQAHGGEARWGWRLVHCGSWAGRGEAVGPGDLDSDTGTGVGDGEGGGRRSLEKTLGLESDASPPTSTSPSTSTSNSPATGAAVPAEFPSDLNWIKPALTQSYTPMAPFGDTAQVDPYLFTTSMLALAQEKGVRYLSGRVSHIAISRSSGRPRVTGATYTPLAAPAPSPSPASPSPTPQPASVSLPATHVILSAGAWSAQLVPALPITGTRAHSITILPPGPPLAPYVLFTSIALPPAPSPSPAPASPSSSSAHSARSASPELYARPTGEVYCCGAGDDAPVPSTVDDVSAAPGACARLRAHVASISPVLRAGRVGRQQACFLPVVVGGAEAGDGPIVGAADAIAEGLVIAAGHTCWGICNAPGTAKAIAELVMDGEITCANLDKLKPSRFAIV